VPRAIRFGQSTDASPKLRRVLGFLLIAAAAAAACTPSPRESATPAPSPTSPPAHAPEISFGLIGGVVDHNAWAMFAGEDYSYNSYAVRAGWWPRLYGLSVPGQQLEMAAAAGVPSAIHQEGIFYTATVPVRTALLWSDGKPLNARDVAFTINTAVEFELGFDWQDYYDAALLDHAEAVSADTVKFYFTRPPGVREWQYGALQGPVVQEAFWSAKVAEAAEALPGDELRSSLDNLRGRIATLQQEANDLYTATLYAQGPQARELQADLKRKQGSLDEVTNDLNKAQTTLEQSLQAAQTALFEQDDRGEPLAGAWLPQASASTAANAPIINVPNPAYPGPAPHFDRAVFHIYATRQAAEEAVKAGHINAVLSPEPKNEEAESNVFISPTRSMRFILFNLDADGVSDAVLRRALVCMIDQYALAASLPSGGAPRTAFVPPEDETWSSADAALPCAGLDAASRLAQAAQMLRDAGYTWDQDPIAGGAGQGLKRPDGSPASPLHLLAPAPDEQRMASATYVVQQGQLLGLPIRAQPVAADAVDYAVLSSREFDMAIVGWRVSPYPGYLCDWFEAGGPFHYDPTALTSHCGQLDVTSDLDAARGLLIEIQRTLADELPLVPLYADVVREPVNGISYPFTAVLDGLAGVYGAPALASPSGP